MVYDPSIAGKALRVQGLTILGTVAMIRTLTWRVFSCSDPNQEFPVQGARWLEPLSPLFAVLLPSTSLGRMLASTGAELGRYDTHHDTHMCYTFESANIVKTSHLLVHTFTQALKMSGWMLTRRSHLTVLDKDYGWRRVVLVRREQRPIFCRHRAL